jgi:hypothetical protein
MPSPSSLRRSALLLWCLGSVPGLSHAAVGAVPSQVIESIAAREYHAGDTADGLQAPNRAQGFRTWFGADGLALTTRDASADPLLQLRLAQWGRSDELRAPAPGLLVADEARVERRGVDLTEWYINRPEGLEHGFDVAAAPPGAGALEIHLDSDRPARQVHADLIEFDSGERSLRYGKLKVQDANGTILPAQIQLRGSHRVVVHVDDVGARYPVTVNTLLTGVADVTRVGPQAAAEFGIRIANAGDVNNDGNQDLVVGAFRFDNGAVDTGAAYVFFGPDFDAPAFLSISQAGAAFGAGVGGGGDLNNDGFDDVVIGAPNFDASAGQPNTGAVYVYFGGSGAFDTTADASVNGPTQSGNMGAAVSGVGDVNNDGIDDLAVGVPRFNPGGNMDEGTVLVYFGSSSFNLGADAVLDLDGQPVATVGTAIAGRGDLNGDGIDDVVVGAAGYEVPGGSLMNEGAAVVFFGGDGSLDGNHDGILRTGVNAANGGASVAIGDFNGDGIDDVASGAPLYETVASPGGAVQIWYGATGAFNTVVDVTLTSVQSGEQFGRSIATVPDLNQDGRDELLVGAPTANNGLGVNTGEARAYFPDASGFATTPDLELEGAQTGALFGTSLASGDFNGDGQSDVAVGEPSWDVNINSQNHGAIHVYFGTPDPIFSDGFE